MEVATKALGPAGIIILVTGAGGVYKQMLITTKVGDALADILQGSGLGPLILAWTLTTIIRIAQGSATVAMVTGAALISPFLAAGDYSTSQLALVTIAIAAGGSLTAAHSCAILAGAGNVVCWGSDLNGQASPPASVGGHGGAASAIAAGGNHSCAIQTGTGDVVCWGLSSDGQAFPPASVDGTSGTASAIAIEGSHSLAIQSDSVSVPALPPFGLAVLAAVLVLMGSRWGRLRTARS